MRLPLLKCKAAKNLIHDRDINLFMGLGTELSRVGMAAISTSVLGLLCKDGVWMGRLRLACREVRVFSLWNLAVGGAQGGGA